jgi:membrane protease YdiL (CAAX protease family)
LADAGEPSWGKSAILVAVVLALSGAFLLMAGYLVPAASEEVATGRFFAMAVAVVAAAVVAAAFYAWLLPTSLRRGAVVAGGELLLGVLLAALVAGVVLVGLAVYQLQRRPEPQRIPGSVSAVVSLNARA